MTPGAPAYKELPTLGDTGEHHSWDHFGRDDEFGCLNFIDDATVVSAAREVRTGQIVNLNLPVGQPQPQFWATREQPIHRQLIRRNIRDDAIDNYFTQGSTQIDGFRHARYRQYGFYGGRQDADLDDRGELSIANWAERGVLGRGVLVDVAAYLAAQGTPLSPENRMAIEPELIEATLAAQGTESRPGDMVLIRTGWLEWYRGLDEEMRNELGRRWNADRSLAALPGISPSRACVGWLWDHRTSLLALDNPTAETLPWDSTDGWGHHRLLVLLGLPLGELWDLSGLSAQCARLGRWSFLLSCAPINLPRGAASPANAYAVM
jgi:kynurenine formamidase